MVELAGELDDGATADPLNAGESCTADLDDATPLGEAGVLDDPQPLAVNATTATNPSAPACIRRWPSRTPRATVGRDFPDIASPYGVALEVGVGVAVAEGVAVGVGVGVAVGDFVGVGAATGPLPLGDA